MGSSGTLFSGLGVAGLGDGGNGSSAAIDADASAATQVPSPVALGDGGTLTLSAGSGLCNMVGNNGKCWPVKFIFIRANILGVNRFTILGDVLMV